MNTYINKKIASAAGKVSKRGKAKPKIKDWIHLDEFITDEFTSHFITIMRRYKKDGKDAQYIKTYLDVLKFFHPVMKSTEIDMKQDININIISDNDIMKKI